MAKKKKHIRNKKERVLLSDVLPYEVPVTFSNKSFYDFLIENNIELKDNTITWSGDDPALKSIIKLIFGLTDENKIKNETENKIDISNQAVTTQPFGFKISHKNIDFRELTVVHPLNQLSLITFYEKYKALILYYSGISKFSLRKPFKIAKFTYHKDKTHFENLAHDHEHKTVEEFNKEYENLKTFFVYKSISNIYKFYESYRYQRCEKKYDYMFKFDISKCFDSIYTHSISWALLNNEMVKDQISKDKKNKSFSDAFDKFIRNANYGETNGIVIGPEFSRIFAELILQQIDKTVLNNLKESDPSLYHKRDFEVFRYVDDYFVFYNNEADRDKILKEFRLELKNYKLYINDEKTSNYEKPIITGITRAKLKITDLLNENLTFKVSTEVNEENEEEKKYSFYVSSNRLITRFKSIIKETDITYNNILNYTLACVDRKIQKLIKIYSGINDKKVYEQKVLKSFIEILDFTFFLYTVTPRVNTTIKLCLILSKVIKFTKIKGNFNVDNRHLIFKKIYDEIFLVLNKYQNTEHTQVETLYLLITLKELGSEYRINENLLSQYFGIDLNKKVINRNLNYFSITVLLFYVENKKRYRPIKLILRKHILSKFKEVSFENRGKSSELTLMLLDLISCPFLERKFKNELFSLYGLKGQKDGLLKSAIIEYRDNWFTKWTSFDFGKALEAKKSEEVY